MLELSDNCVKTAIMKILHQSFTNTLKQIRNKCFKKEIEITKKKKNGNNRTEKYISKIKNLP